LSKNKGYIFNFKKHLPPRSEREWLGIKKHTRNKKKDKNKKNPSVKNGRA
jgi:hypothetical protein